MGIIYNATTRETVQDSIMIVAPNMTMEILRSRARTALAEMDNRTRAGIALAHAVAIGATPDPADVRILTAQIAYVKALRAYLAAGGDLPTEPNWKTIAEGS